MAGTASYALDILSCPPSGSIKSIVYTTPTKLSVTEGANTLMSIDLSSFFIPITNALQTTFTLAAGSTQSTPTSQFSFDYCGLNDSSTAKFVAFFPTYPDTATTNQYVEWAFSDEFNDNVIQVLSPVLIDTSSVFDDDTLEWNLSEQIFSGTTAESIISDTFYYLNTTKDIAKILGSILGFSSTDVYIICTRGGLKLWSLNDPMILFNTFNSEIPSNEITCVKVTPSGVIWLGTSNGLSMLTYSSGTFSFTNFNTFNSGIISHVINDVDYLNGKLSIATDAGISIYDTENDTWENYSNYTVNEINTSTFTSIKMEGIYVIVGSDNGVYVFDTSSQAWSLYDSSITGWNLGDNVKTVEIYQSEVFVGLTGGIMSFTIGATYSQEIFLESSMTGPYTSISKIVYSNDNLYVGHETGAISSYDVTGATWSYGVKGLTGALSNGLNTLEVSDYLFFGNDQGFARFSTASYTINSLPLVSQKADILFTYPNNGDFPVSLTQKVYFGFSKPVDKISLLNHTILEKSTGLTLSYSLTSTSSNCLYEVVPGTALDYSTQYNFSISKGLTSADGSYFRQTVDSTFYTTEKVPVNGWRILGKQMILSGTDEHLLEPIVFRNPQSFDVNILSLVAI